jgi:hypothetical protein
VDAENDRDWTTGKAGRRNAGMETEGAEAIALSSPFERAVESIANMLSSCLGMVQVEVRIFWSFAIKFLHVISS